MVITKKGVNKTFDDLWDWRLKQGNLLLGNDIKNSITLYQPNPEDKFVENSKPADALLKESERALKPMNMEQRADDDDSNENDEETD